ncbi:hypothetical protein BVC71_15185 [Marivivens niveibacter]|uniref:Uncharacterized protein n=1 Tax=Marivivens niveibacter TaxID=1930667 RepID=A0A251WVK2_9RHOB|nr:hypothetical protein [Marivivens niveibacter]OUD08148.1 hypothetical protein BVC71_15185 [Marivivens niveibacter]
MKKFLAVAAVSLSTMFGAAANAQVDLSAELAALNLTCSTDPASCQLATEALMQTLRNSGLPASEINAGIGAVVATVVNVANSLPPAQKQQLAGAVALASDPNVGFVGSSPEVLEQIAAANNITDALETGGDVDSNVISQLGSGN